MPLVIGSCVQQHVAATAAGRDIGVLDPRIPGTGGAFATSVSSDAANLEFSKTPGGNADVAFVATGAQDNQS